MLSIVWLDGSTEEHRRDVPRTKEDSQALKKLQGGARAQIAQEIIVCWASSNLEKSRIVKEWNRPGGERIKKGLACGLILMLAGLVLLSFSRIVVLGDEYTLKASIDNYINYNEGLPTQVSVSAYFNADEQFYLNFTKGRFWGNSYDINNGGLEPAQMDFAPNVSILPYKTLSFHIYTPSGDVVSSEVYLVAGTEPFAVVYFNQSTDFVPLLGGNLSLGYAAMEGAVNHAGNYTFTTYSIDPYVLGDINDTYNVVAAPPRIQADPPLTMSLHEVTAQAASGPIYIRADGSIYPSIAPIYTADNITYTLRGNITAGAGADGIVVERDNIVLNGAGYTATGSGSGNGLTLNDSSNVTLDNLTIESFTEGIYLYSSSGDNLSGNTVTANKDYGLWFSLSSDNTLSFDNMIANNGNGIWLDSSSKDNSIYRNKLTNNYAGIWLNASSNNSISGNNITNNRYGIWLLYSSSNNSIFVNDITNNWEGIHSFAFSNYNSISGNNITANGWDGIELDSSSFDSVSGNNIANNEYGVLLDYSSNNSISGNNVTDHTYDGIELDSSSFDSVSGNNIANNEYGVFLDYSSSNSISGNNITANNGEGVLLDYSSGNSIFHNNFVNNAVQAHSSESMNTWDDGYPSGGNYWSNYTGADTHSGPYQNMTGSDGTGDIPYKIDANDTDNYPLMGPSSVFDAGTWNGTSCNINVISNSTILDFHLDASLKIVRFNVTGPEGTDGFCTITIPNIIVQSLWPDGAYAVLLNDQPLTFRNWTDIPNTYIYINYTHSQHQITIVPEYPSFVILTLFMATTLVAGITFKKKKKNS